MNSKIYLKVIYVIFLNALLVLFIYLVYDRAGTRARIYDPLVLADYKIVDENKECDEGKELIFSDKKHKYYLPCKGSYNIYLEWTDGSKDLIKNALKNNKVTIDSLTDHGLKIIEYEK